MARPKKSAADRRWRWDALYVTDAEREEIETAAQEARLAPGRYLYACHRKQAPIRAYDKLLAVVALTEASQHLDAIASEIASVESKIDIVRVSSQLLSIERHFRRAVLVLPNPTRRKDFGEGPEA